MNFKRVLLQFSEVLDCTNHLRSIRVLVVIPRNNLYLIGIIVNLAYHCLCSIEQRAETHTDDIRRNNLILIVTEALCSCRLHCCIDTFNRNILALNNSNEDCCRTGWSWNTLCRTDQLTVQLRNYKTDSFSCTC